MLACWALEPSKRPGFEDLYDTLHYIINEIGDHTNYILTDSEDDATKPSLRHSSSLLSLISSQVSIHSLYIVNNDHAMHIMQSVTEGVLFLRTKPYSNNIIEIPVIVSEGALEDDFFHSTSEGTCYRYTFIILS